MIHSFFRGKFKQHLKQPQSALWSDFKYSFLLEGVHLNQEITDDESYVIIFTMSPNKSNKTETGEAVIITTSLTHTYNNFLKRRLMKTCQLHTVAEVKNKTGGEILTAAY